VHGSRQRLAQATQSASCLAMQVSPETESVGLRNDVEYFDGPGDDLDVDCPATAAELEGVPAQYRQYADVFSKKKSKSLPPHRPEFDHCIKRLPDARLGTSPMYRHTLAERRALQEHITDFLERGFIYPCKSSVSSPVIFVPKKGTDELRMCVDISPR